MTPLLSPAWAIGGLAIHSTDDPHLVDGTHYRLFTDPRLGLPMRPVHVDRLDLGVDAVDAPIVLDAFPPLRHDVTWTNRSGVELLPPIVVTPDEPVTAHIPKQILSRCIWLKVETDPSASLRADIFRSTERGDRMLAARDAAPLSLGAAKIDGVVVSGTGVIEGITWLDGFRLVIDTDWPEINEMGLPRDNRARYVDPSPGAPLLKALQRVHRGAPLRLGLHDEPTASDPASASTTTPRREDAKAAALGLLAADALDALLDDTSASQYAIERSEALTEGTDQYADTHVPEATWKPIDLVHTAMHDPAIARSLGFMDLELPDVFTPGEHHVIVYRMRSWWALDPALFGPVEKGSFLPSIGGLVLTDQSAAGGPAPDESPDGFPIFEMYGLAVAVGHAPPLAPAPPTVDPERAPTTPTTADGLGPWLPATAPSAQRRATVDVRGLEPAATLAYAVEDGGVVTGMNELIDVVGQDEDRALLIVPAVPDDAVEPGTGRLTHRSVPEGGLTIRVAQADAFGRWSGWGERQLAAKTRPAPPEPVVDLWYERAVVADGDAGGALWGELTARVQVPSVESLAPASNLLDHLHLTGDVDGVGFAVDVPAPDPYESEIVVPIAAPDAALLSVGQAVQASATARWVDTAGVESAESRPRTVSCVDPRRPHATEAPPTLDWTAWPDATGTARVSLTWTPAGAQARFRVHTADEQRLRHQAQVAVDDGEDPDGALASFIAAFDGAADKPTRAQALRDHHGAFDPDWFEGLTDEALVSTGAPMTFQHSVSGALDVLITYKVVAETDVGVVASFDDTPLWVWAVPDRRGPGRPLLEIVESRTDPPRSVTLRLRVTGDPDAVARYRLRRSVVHSDPRRMPIALEADTQFDVVVGDDGTETKVKEMLIVDDGSLAHDRTGQPTRFRLGSLYSWTIDVQSPSLPGSSRPGAWSRPSAPVSTRLLGDPFDPGVEPGIEIPAPFGDLQQSGTIEEAS